MLSILVISIVQNIASSLVFQYGPTTLVWVGVLNFVIGKALWVAARRAAAAIWGGANWKNRKDRWISWWKDCEDWWLGNVTTPWHWPRWVVGMVVYIIYHSIRLVLRNIKWACLRAYQVFTWIGTLVEENPRLRQPLARAVVGVLTPFIDCAASLKAWAESHRKSWEQWLTVVEE